MHAVLVLAAPPTLAPEQATPSSSPISAGNELSTGGKGGGGFQTKFTQTHTLAPPAGAGETHNKGIVRSRPGGLGPRHCATVCWGLASPRTRPSPSEKRNKGGGVSLKQGGQMKGSQTDAQTHASARKAGRMERRIPGRGGGEGRGQLFPEPLR